LAFAAPISHVVTEANKQDWVFNPDPTTATPYEFTEDAASVGDGSLYVLPIQNDSNGVGHDGNRDKFIAQLPVNYTSDQLNSVSFDFQLGEGVDATKANQVYLNIYTNLPGSTSFYDCRFDQAATVGSSTDFTTVTFDSTVAPTNVEPRGTPTPDCPETLSGLPAGSTVKAITLNVGDTSASDGGVSAYFDNVVINAAGNTITYDFELNAPKPMKASTKDDCKDGKWETGFQTQYKNQGDCVSSVASKGKANGNPSVIDTITNAFRGLFSNNQ
jgi:hypothetical protein